MVNKTICSDNHDSLFANVFCFNIACVDSMYMGVPICDVQSHANVIHIMSNTQFFVFCKILYLLANNYSSDSEERQLFEKLQIELYSFYSFMMATFHDS